MTEYIYDTSRVETQLEQGFTGEEIVRCRDCAYRGWSDAGGYFCARGIGLTVEPNGFCSWGERKSE